MTPVMSPAFFKSSSLLTVSEMFTCTKDLFCPVCGAAVNDCNWPWGGGGGGGGAVVCSWSDD